MKPKLALQKKENTVEKLLGAAAIAAVALAVGPAQAAKVVAGCSGPNLEKTETAIDAMADGEGKRAAEREVAVARDSMVNGNRRGCTVHLSRAMHDIQAQAPYPEAPANSFARAPGDTQGQAPAQNQWGWEPLKPAL
jgi:hypothetical protein